MKVEDVNLAALSSRMALMEWSGNWARNLIISASNLAKAVFRVESRHTWDHLVKVLIRTIKYLNGPEDECIVPQISPWILSEKFTSLSWSLRGDGRTISFHREHAEHGSSSRGMTFWFLRWYPVKFSIIRCIIDTPWWPSLSCHKVRDFGYNDTMRLNDFHVYVV